MITLERLKEVLLYNPDTGEFTWKIKTNYSFANFAPGRPAGGLNFDGYVKIQIDRKQYAAHRLAWLYTFGEWPNDEIDHENLDRADNRLSNLRVATTQQNKANRKSLSNNKIGLKGVSLKRGKWRAVIWLEGKSVHLGTFDNPEDAHSAYCQAASAAWGDFSRA